MIAKELRTLCKEEKKRKPCQDDILAGKRRVNVANFPSLRKGKVFIDQSTGKKGKESLKVKLSPL